MRHAQRMSTPEAGVQRAILDLLAAERIFAIRLNTGVFRNAKGRPVFTHSGGAGVADILAFPQSGLSYQRRPGGPLASIPAVLWIECKSDRGRQTPEQVRFQLQVESAGHAYIVARSSDDVLRWLRGPH